MPSSEFELALEEIRLLQTIVGRNEGLALQVRRWLLALLGALVVALFADRSKLQWLHFLLSACSLAILFALIESSVRVTVRQAIERVGVIEEQLRTNGKYDGPAIVRSLSKNDRPFLTLRAAIGEARVMGFRTFYLAPLLAVAVVAYARNAS